MKKMNFTNFVLCLLTLFAFQAQAQYSGVAYQGNTPQVGATVGTTVNIEFEYFDALSGAPGGDGANFNDNANSIPGAGGTYNDKSFGGTANGNSLRTTGDVDIEADPGSTGHVVRDIQNAEYTIYTINVVTAGTYTMNVNYKHSGSAKRFQFYNHAADGTGQTLLYDSQDGNPSSPGTTLIPSTAGVFATSAESEEFFLPAGTSLIRFRHLSAGPSFDYFGLTLVNPVAAPNEYHGVAYQDSIPQLGVTEGVPVQIEFEHYDALSGDSSGDGANFSDPVDSISGTMMGTYYDDSPGGHSNGNTARATSDVDIKADGSGDVVTDVKPNEYTIYTVNVVTPGFYHMGVNYKHGGTSKDIKVYTHNASDGSDKTLIYDSNTDGGLPATGGAYITTDSLGSFELPAGPLLLRIRTLDSGPSYDYFTMTLDSSTVLPAQYDGVAYQGNIPQLGVTPGATVQIEFENYDALSTDANGDGGNFNDPTDNIPSTGMGTYYDNSPGGHADGNTARATSDVDIKAEGSGNVVTDVKPNEYTIYTVNVVNAGTYYLGMNYKHAGTSKDIKLYSHNPDGSGKTLLYDSNPAGGIPANDYVTENNLGSFDLPAGPLLIRVRTLDSGPSYDYFTLTYMFPVSTQDRKLEETALKVFPNPANDGVFNIDINTEEVWEVYSLTGAKVLGGSGNRVDLSTFPKGVYVLRTQNASVKLISF